MARIDPLRGFRFLVEIEGITGGSFTRVKGLGRELKHESFKEGGVNDYEHKLVSLASYPPLVLEHGLALPMLWQWVDNAVNGIIVRHKISIRLLNESGLPAWTWHADHALPVKWSCTDLDANSSQILMETIELAHHGLRRDP
jgi:phage tail-like protein